jgi:capsular polysaccharide transport system permease protein
MDQPARTRERELARAPTTDQPVAPREEGTTTITLPGPYDPARDLHRRLKPVRHWLGRNLVFLLTVIVPTLAAVFYYGFIAVDVYTSESRFLVRSTQRQAQGSVLSNLLEGTGLTRAQDDTYSVHDYILSRDAARELDAKLGILKAYSTQGDLLTRFAALGWDRSFEAFYKYYGQDVVSVEYDPESSISVLTVHAFTADEAAKINLALLDMSERLVNSLNDRSRHDLVHFAEEEVKESSDNAKRAATALLAFRSQQSVFEPDKQATAALEGVAKIQEDLVEAETQLAQLKKLSPSNPQIVGLESRIKTLRTAKASEAAKVTNGSGSLSVYASTFQRLVVDSQFADQQLGLAMAALESARTEAARKQLYLDRLVQPNRPDKAMQPRRLRSMLTVLLVGLVLWGIVSLVLASIREHSDG